ncbi:recombinase family protein [Oceanobacillus sp. CFH 90083]|uniref:recombinase family protein n=1 Tax=Oceanobacillus sp. CFH 90083 TaxID=2592336 RepID=UPI00128BE4B1|nr:recombinase family protein [Oceanobacillus sp. CFH 90083]
MIFGYKRPIHNDKSCQNQLDIEHISFDKIYEEAHHLPKKREQLEELLISLSRGDQIFVQSFFVLADSTLHLMEILKLCEKDGVIIHFLQEGMNSSDVLACTLSEMLEHMITFQADITRHSTIIGMERAKEKGKKIGRPKKADENVKKAMLMYHSGNYTLRDIKMETGISKSTLYRYLENEDNL